MNLWSLLTYSSKTRPIERTSVPAPLNPNPHLSTLLRAFAYYKPFTAGVRIQMRKSKRPRRASRLPRPGDEILQRVAAFVLFAGQYGMDRDEAAAESGPGREKGRARTRRWEDQPRARRRAALRGFGRERRRKTRLIEWMGRLSLIIGRVEGRRSSLMGSGKGLRDDEREVGPGRTGQK